MKPGVSYPVLSGTMLDQAPMHDWQFNNHGCSGVQIHIVQKDVHQDTKGYITVVVPDAELVKKRLAAVKEALEGTKFRCAQAPSPDSILMSALFCSIGLGMHGQMQMSVHE